MDDIKYHARKYEKCGSIRRDDRCVVAMVIVRNSIDAHDSSFKHDTRQNLVDDRRSIEVTQFDVWDASEVRLEYH